MKTARKEQITQIIAKSSMNRDTEMESLGLSEFVPICLLGAEGALVRWRSSVSA